MSDDGDLDKLFDTIIAFLQADTPQEARYLIEQHPELLHPAMDEVLQQLAQEQDDEEITTQIEERRALLSRCREAGIDQAFQEEAGQLRTAQIAALHPPGFEADMARIVELNKQSQSDPSALIQLSQLVTEMLSRPLAEEYSQFRAAMLFVLANAYQNSQTDHREENLSRAIEYYKQALQIFTLETTPVEYAMTQRYLGNTYTELETGDSTTNLMHAIECYQAAFTVFTRQAAPYEYADTCNQLGLAYSDLPTGDRSSYLAKAIECYQQALAIYASRPLSTGYAMAINNLGNAYANLPTGSRAENLARAIECYNVALTIFTAEKAPDKYIRTQHNLGDAYATLPIGDPSENLLHAIECYEAALALCTPQYMPLEYATIQNSIGAAYVHLLAGKQPENLVHAIECYQAALTIFTLRATPQDYAMVQNNLGIAYASILTGDQSENLRKAIACYEQALKVYTLQATPLKYASVQQNLGDAYSALPSGNIRKNQLRAIECYEAALTVYTPQATPYDFAGTQNSLGKAYTNLPTGDRTENVQSAIACYKAALSVYTPQSSPQEYAVVQHNLGTAYSDLPAGDRAENLALAIECGKAALTIWTAETSPLHYALTQQNLGVVFYDLQTGDRAENLFSSVEHFKAALAIYTPETTPLDYARAKSNLGNAYTELPTGDRAENVKYAIACFEEALRFQTPEFAPYAYAGTQNNLGAAYLALPTDSEANLAHAAECFKKALSIYTPETTPHFYRLASRNLGHLYFDQRNWASALVTYRQAIEAGEQLYRAGMSGESKMVEVVENVTLFQNAAYAAAQAGDPTGALLLLEQGKTRLLADALRLQIPHPPGVPSPVWTNFVKAGAAVRASQSTDAFALNENENIIQAYKKRELRLQQANEALDRAVELVREYAPDFLRETSLPTILDRLPSEHTGLVAFCCTDQGSIGLVVSRNDEQPVRVVDILGFTRSALRNLLFGPDAHDAPTGGWLVSYQQYLDERTGPAFESLQAVMTHTLDEISQRLLAPILTILSPDITQLILLPSGELFLLPLHAAPLSSDLPDRLCDRYQVIYAPSLEVMITSQIKTREEKDPDLYALVNPTADLLFAALEGATIAQLFDKGRVDEGREGTKRSVQGGVMGRTHVHFACHCRYNWKDPSASGLDLADGHLTLYDLQNGVIDLTSARLVTLPACETGMIDVTTGKAEEYIGIPAGFLLAGVPCVVSSLWAVPDLSTALLIQRFYQNHFSKGMFFAAALREAQQWLRDLNIRELLQFTEQRYEQARPAEKATLLLYLRHYRYQARHRPTLRPFAHPFYWAAFTYTGSWEVGSANSLSQAPVS